MTDPVILKELGDRVEGVVTAGMTSADSDRPEYKEYADALAAAYPDLAGTASSVFAYGYYTAMEAIAPGARAGRRRSLRRARGVP